MNHIHPPITELIEFAARHVIIGPVDLDGDRFYPEYAADSLQRWDRLEQSIGHTAWMSNVARRARGNNN